MRVAWCLYCLILNETVRVNFPFFKGRQQKFASQEFKIVATALNEKGGKYFHARVISLEYVYFL